MVSKNNIQHKMEADAKRVPHYGLRKLGIGVASVLLGTTLYFGNARAVQADTVNTGNQATENEKQTTTSNTLNGTEVPLTTSTTSEKDNGTDKAATAETQGSEQKDETTSITTNTADKQNDTSATSKSSQLNSFVQLNSNVANKNDTSNTDMAQVSSKDGNYTLTFDKANGGVIGQTGVGADVAQYPNNKFTLTLNLVNAKANDHIEITIPGADTIYNVTAGDLKIQYGSVVVTDDKEKYLWEITVDINSDVDQTVKLPIYINPVQNGAYTLHYSSQKYPLLHDPIGDTTKQITWTENGEPQDETGLSFISRQMPNWNPAQNVTDSSNLSGKQLINNSNITYTYAVNEDWLYII